MYLKLAVLLAVASLCLLQETQGVPNAAQAAELQKRLCALDSRYCQGIARQLSVKSRDQTNNHDEDDDEEDDNTAADNQLTVRNDAAVHNRHNDDAINPANSHVANDETAGRARRRHKKLLRSRRSGARRVRRSRHGRKGGKGRRGRRGRKGRKGRKSFRRRGKNARRRLRRRNKTLNSKRIVRAG